MQSSGWVGSKDKLDMNLALEEDRKKKKEDRAHIYYLNEKCCRILEAGSNIIF